MSPFRLYLYRLVASCLPETRFFGAKAALLRWCGATVGANVRIVSSAVFTGTGAVTIGDDVWIGARNFISSVAPASVTVGSHCDFGPDVMILTGSHEIDPTGAHTAGKGTAASVSVADGCWLGARSTVLPGVALPRKSLVAAGAVVTRTPDPPGEGCLFAGVPARAKRKIGEKSPD